MAEAPDILVIGGGPAGLMAADTALQAGASVVLAEGKPSPARKLLLAGKSGLNITKQQPIEAFIASYIEGSDFLAPMLRAFDPDAVRAWSNRLGVSVFTGTSGHTFTNPGKASPLLRAWLNDLHARGLDLRRRWQWTAWEGANTMVFETPEGTVRLTPRATILALGGASWPRLGSDGAWRAIFEERGIAMAPFRPSNCGFEHPWSGHMTRFFGAPVKPVRLSSGGRQVRGEFVITRYGIEGGGVYRLADLLRDGAPLDIDLAPNLAPEIVAARLGTPRHKTTLTNHLRKTLGLTPVKIALLRECAPDAIGSEAEIGRTLKSLRLAPLTPRPIEEAISSAGGVRTAALDDTLMLVNHPGVFCAGEMIDWDAHTGGYLMTACLATGHHAGKSAVAWRGERQSESGSD